MGAEIPTTSIHWKHVAFDLEWIVRQMGWSPPWNAPKEKGPKFRQRRRISESEVAAAPPTPRDAQQLPLPGDAANRCKSALAENPAANAAVKEEIRSEEAGSDADGSVASVHSTKDGEEDCQSVPMASFEKLWKRCRRLAGSLPLASCLDRASCGQNLPRTLLMTTSGMVGFLPSGSR